MPTHRRRIGIFVCLVAAALLGLACPRTVSTPGPVPSTPTPPSVEPGEELVGLEVVARVEKLEYKAFTDDLSDGSVLVSHLVSFGVETPERLPYLVVAHSQSLPAIGDRRIQLGDEVIFVLPKDWRYGDIELANLKSLRFLK